MGSCKNGQGQPGEGKKQSKTEGNVTAPIEIINKSGADVLRLWVAAVDYTEDVRCSDEILQRVTDAYRKFRNTLRYALGNLDGFNPETDQVAFGEMLEPSSLHGVSELEERVLLYRKERNHNVENSAWAPFLNKLLTGLIGVGLLSEREVVHTTHFFVSRPLPPLVGASV